jgi:hypothetical protein
MNGGLSKGELGVILAAFGVGKSTMITKIANTGYNLGYNVVQIFFEDNPKVIQRKHITCWTGINLNDLTTEKERIKVELETVKEFKGNLILKKFPSDGTTITHIKQYLRKLTSDGIKPDLVLVDYIDCIQPSKRVDDANVAEGNVMREFESTLTIDTNSSNDVSFLDFGKNQDKKKSNRIQDALKLRQEFINNNQKI